jgi:IS5 family transposase
MTSFIDFAFREEYERVKALGDKLSEIDTLINWEAFRPIVKDMYDNKTEKGGNPGRNIHNLRSGSCKSG